MVSERWATGSSSRDWRMVDLVKMRPELPNSWKRLLKGGEARRIFPDGAAEKSFSRSRR